MTLDDIKRMLDEGGYRIVTEERLSNDTGFQLRLDGGAIVNVFDNGTVQCQGRNKEAVEALLQSPGSVRERRSHRYSPNTKVFVAYGHDAAARAHLEAMLRRWGLEPLILDQLPSEGQTIIEKLENYADQVGFGVVLATP